MVIYCPFIQCGTTQISLGGPVDLSGDLVIASNSLLSSVSSVTGIIRGGLRIVDSPKLSTQAVHAGRSPSTEARPSRPTARPEADPMIDRARRLVAQSIARLGDVDSGSAPKPVVAPGWRRSLAPRGLALLGALAAPPAAWSQASLTVTAGFDIAAFVGSVDLSALFAVTADRLGYRPGGVRLPSGEHDLLVYAVADSSEWREVGWVPLRVLTPRGFERAKLSPKISVNNKGQVREGQRACGEPTAST